MKNNPFLKLCEANIKKGKEDKEKKKLELFLKDSNLSYNIFKMIIDFYTNFGAACEIKGRRMTINFNNITFIKI